MKKYWWLTEENISKSAIKERKKAYEWLIKETKIKEIKDKEDIIIRAYNKEIQPLKEQIKEIEKKIEKLQKNCDKCLALIQSGDSGLMDILGEKNTTN